MGCPVKSALKGFSTSIMQDLQNAFVSRSFLRSVWTREYQAFRDSREETALHDRLRRWAQRTDLKETSAESALIEEFFRSVWGYVQTGQAGAEQGFTLYPKFPVDGAGARGGRGEADLAIGYFSANASLNTPQVLCEFKDIRSGLDADQKRKGNTRSPVRQCLDYLSHARKGMVGSEPILPTWGLVTDMNEFRLYWYDRGYQQSVRFIIRPNDLFQGRGLLVEDEDGRFDRFLFAKLFHRDTLLTTGGRSLLSELIKERRFRDRELEDKFYGEYRAFRTRLYTTLLESNPEGTARFPGTRGRLVRLAQKILDRLIFIFFCEDMGQILSFPPKLLQNFLVDRSNDAFFDADGTAIWQDMLRLFRAMNSGAAFGGKPINQFNGGLFAPDVALEALHVPNAIFCQHMQGQNEASITSYKETALYLCATYNYASDMRAGSVDASRTLGLYTLGRIFEQSITELEILEADADGRPSINKQSKRKTDGVYYTPEWVVERIVDGTLGPRLIEIKQACGWPADDVGLPSQPAIDAYIERLKTFTVLDPACGSGAFLITALRYLVEEWTRVWALRKSVTGQVLTGEGDADALIRDILRANIHGVDINPASVEIARLALWLHTARSDRPLSHLEDTIREGNSLIGPEFYTGIQAELYGDEDRERINTFDWQASFPSVFARGGFDAVIGNPPYVKLQNLRAVQPDMASYLIEGRPALGIRPYASTRTGNFDLYLPFIEKGLTLLNEEGRLGYIAPSLWTMNEYGAGLRRLVAAGRHLDRWLDFKSYQVFNEATTYTALQFFAKARQGGIRVAEASDGKVPLEPFSDTGRALPYGRQEFGDRWLLVTGEERDMIDRLTTSCRRLADPVHTSHIFQGLITSADAVYHLRRVGPGRYLCAPDGDPKPAPYEVEIEDALMKPLVSGAEAKRYVEPATDTYLIFPYRVNNGVVALLDEPSIVRDYPKAWTYLNSFKDILRLREARRNRHDIIIEAPFDDERWYRFGRHQNIDKQEVQKLVVARLVEHLGISVDVIGGSYLDNVDVGGIILADGQNPWFIAGVLNSRVADFVFRRISKPFRGNYFSANKQFIAPLPIPPAAAEERAQVAAGAEALQRAHTRRRDLLAALARRLGGAGARKRPDTWLFPDLLTKRDRLADAPRSLGATEARAWAAERYSLDVKACHTTLGVRLLPSAALDAALRDGELTFTIAGVPIVERVFVSAAEGPFLLAQWKVVALTFSIPEKEPGRKLADALRSLVPATNAALVEQVIELQRDLTANEVTITAAEADMNGIVERLYGITPGELVLITNSAKTTRALS